MHLLVESQADPANKQRLMEAFRELGKDVNFSGDNYRTRIKFKDQFDRFVVNVRGFLLVK